MNETIEMLLDGFLEARHTGELADELHRISTAIDKQITAGAVKQDVIADYERAAMRMGFYAGFAAALELQAAKAALAVQNRKRGKAA